MMADLDIGAVVILIVVLIIVAIAVRYILYLRRMERIGSAVLRMPLSDLQMADGPKCPSCGIPTDSNWERCPNCSERLQE